jgi:hypothetical protein
MKRLAALVPAVALVFGMAAPAAAARLTPAARQYLADAAPYSRVVTAVDASWVALDLAYPVSSPAAYRKGSAALARGTAIFRWRLLHQRWPAGTREDVRLLAAACSSFAVAITARWSAPGAVAWGLTVTEAEATVNAGSEVVRGDLGLPPASLF